VKHRTDDPGRLGERLSRRADVQQEVQIEAALNSGSLRYADEALDRRLVFETLLSDLSSRFINLRPEEVDDEIKDAMRRVCEPLGIDSAVLWQWSGKGRAVIAPTHLYRAHVDFPAPESLHEDFFPWCRQQMLAGQVVAVSSLGELPAEAAVDRESARLAGIKSALTLPLSVGGEPPVGALGFNAMHSERGWSAIEIKRLQLVAQIFTNALARKRRDQILQENKNRLTAGAELAGLAFYEVDFSKNVIYFDESFRTLCGVPLELEQAIDVIEFWMAHLHPDDRERVLDVRKQLHDGRLDRMSIQYRFLHPENREMWIQHLVGVGKRDTSGRAVNTHSVLRDVTEQKRVESELRDLSHRLIRAQEDERALLARELHDDVTQRLAVLAIELGRAELAAPDGANAALMQTVREGLTRLSEDVHALAYQLHPSILQELGLAEALRTECERRIRQGRINLTLDLDPLPVLVGKDAAICLFRVAQEALNNVVHHANARVASVTLRNMDGGLLLAVRDDGDGFDQSLAAERMHLGLASMRERISLVNGTLDIESVPGEGSTVIAWVPVEGEVR
jgi:signal transduction histidine kinase